MTVRVVVADDSEFFRDVLREALEADRRIAVVAEASDAAEVGRLVQQHAATLVVMDVLMPGMNGLDAIEQVMALHPVPILVLTSQPVGPQTGLVFEATRRGALDVQGKQIVSTRPREL